MKQYLATAMLFICLLATISRADIILGQDSILKFASAEQGREIITVQDEYFLTMTEYNRSAHMQTNRTVTVDELATHFGDNVIPWKESDRARIVSVMKDVTNHLAELSLAFPQTVLISKTTGREASGGAYTRSNCVFITADALTWGNYSLRKVICHELFHILSRSNPEMRDRMYGTIGFSRCIAPVLPEDLAKRIISNPDALTMNHCIGVKVGSKDIHAIPLMYSSEASFDMKHGANYLNRMNVNYLLLDLDKKSLAAEVLYRDGEPRLVNAVHLQGFFDQIGKNTGYILHPEEILAENFAFLIMKQYDVKTPRILRKLREVLPRNK